MRQQDRNFANLHKDSWYSFTRVLHDEARSVSKLVVRCAAVITIAVGVLEMNETPLMRRGRILRGRNL